MRGSRQEVVYFQQYGTAGDVRTTIADYPNERSIALTSYRRIAKFELTLPDAMQFQYDPSTGEGNATGQALVYSGFQPAVNDFFVGPIGDNKLAIYRVSSVNSLSWRNDRVREIGYYFFNMADNGNLQFLESAVCEKRVFDKAMYLGDVSVLLTEDYYADLQELKRLRDVMCLYYYQRFFDTSVNSFRHPEGLYDPYVVRYMANVTPFLLVNTRPMQLYPNTDALYPFTIWELLTNSARRVVDGVYSLTSGTTMTGYANNIMLTPLMNGGVLTVVDEKSPQAALDAVSGYYVFSDKFYHNDYENMSDFEKLVWDTIRTRLLTNTPLLLSNYLRQYLTLTPEEAFYRIPVYLQLIDIAIVSISRRAPGKGF